MEIGPETLFWNGTNDGLGGSYKEKYNHPTSTSQTPIHLSGLPLECDSESEISEPETIRIWSRIIESDTNKTPPDHFYKPTTTTISKTVAIPVCSTDVDVSLGRMELAEPTKATMKIDKIETLHEKKSDMFTNMMIRIESDKQVACTLCDRLFNSERSKNIHRSRVHQSRNKPRSTRIGIYQSTNTPRTIEISSTSNVHTSAPTTPTTPTKKRVSYAVSPTSMKTSDGAGLKLRLVCIPKKQRHDDMNLTEANQYHFSASSPDTQSPGLMHDRSVKEMGHHSTQNYAVISTAQQPYYAQARLSHSTDEIRCDNRTSVSVCNIGAPNDVFTTPDQFNTTHVNVLRSGQVKETSRSNMTTPSQFVTKTTNVTDSWVNMSSPHASTLSLSHSAANSQEPTHSTADPLVTCIAKQIKTKSQSDKLVITAMPPVLDTSLRTKDGLFECRICKRHFISRHSLTGHYKVHYTAKQKPYRCVDCGQRYTSNSNLLYHQSRNCPILKIRSAQSKRLLAPSKTIVPPILVDRIHSQPLDHKKKQTINLEQQNVNLKSTMYEDEHLSKLLDEDADNSVNLRSTTETHPSSWISSKRISKPPLKTFKSDIFDRKLPIKSTKDRDYPTESKNSVYCSTRKSNSEHTGSLGFHTQYHRSKPINNNPNSQAALHDRLRFMLERACHSDSARQKILTFTSAALLASLNQKNTIKEPVASLSPTSMFELLKSVSFENTHTTESDIPVTSTNSNNQQSTPDDILARPELTSSTATRVQTPDQPESYGYACRHCRHVNEVHLDINSLNHHLRTVHGHHNHPVEDPEHLNTRKSVQAPLPSHMTQHGQASSGVPTYTIMTPPAIQAESNAENNHQFVACKICDRVFASSIACRMHYTKAHKPLWSS